LRLRIAELVSTPQHGEPEQKPAPKTPPMAQTTFDLIARRAREKREQKPE
jgi:hypothetical protein